MFIIDLAVGVFVMVQLVNVCEIVSSAKCVCTNYRLLELIGSQQLKVARLSVSMVANGVLVLCAMSSVILLQRTTCPVLLFGRNPF